MASPTPMLKFRKFVTRYLPTIVMIPTLVGVHWFWASLQTNEALVSKEEARELPIIIVRTKIISILSMSYMLLNFFRQQNIFGQKSQKKNLQLMVHRPQRTKINLNVNLLIYGWVLDGQSRKIWADHQKILQIDLKIQSSF